MTKRRVRGGRSRGGGTFEGIVAKLAAVKASGKTCFGAEAHRFELAPPATLASVEAFEKARKVKLPESYRRFLLEVGESGAGPFYGLLPLARWKDGLHVARKHEISALTLTDQGCANYSLLVLEGPRRGRVMYTTDLGDVDYPDDRDFAAWYERWLDEILWDYDISWFGRGMAGREPDFLAALQSARVARRVDGAAAMNRLPAITKRSRDALIRAVETDKPAVQLAAIVSLAKHDRAALEGLIPALLGSRDNDVVLATLRLLDRSPLANALATSSDPRVAGTAIHVGTLTEPELVGLLDGPAWESAMMRLRQQRDDGSAVPTLIAMIEDRDFERRRAAMVCLRIRREARAAEALKARLPREKDRHLQMEIVEGLAALGDVAFVLDVARNGEPALQFRAAHALGSLADVRAIPVLRELATSTIQLPGMAWPLGEQARKALAKLEHALARA